MKDYTPTDAEVEAALEAWFASPPSETDQGLARSMRAALIAARLAACHHMNEKQPKMIPNPLWCDTCEGRGYVVQDAEWDAYAVQCPKCADRKPVCSVEGRVRASKSAPPISPVAAENS